MFIVVHGKAYGHYLMQYPANAEWRPNGWVWTLRLSEAKTFASREDAQKAIDAAGVDMGPFHIKENK